jgi:hypothetical protein
MTDKKPAARHSVSLPAIRNLLLNDILVLFDVCDYFRKTGRLDGSFLGPKQIPKYQITGPLYNESLAFLLEKEFIRGQKTVGGAITNIGPTVDSFKIYGQFSIPNFDNHCRDVISYILNSLEGTTQRTLTAEEIIAATHINPIIIDYVIRLISQKNLAHVSFSLGGARQIIGVTPHLRKWAEVNKT